MKLIISVGVIMLLLTFESSDSSSLKPIIKTPQVLEIPQIPAKDTILNSEIKKLKHNVKQLEIVVGAYKKDSLKNKPRKSWFARTIAKIKL